MMTKQQSKNYLDRFQNVKHVLLSVKQLFLAHKQAELRKTSIDDTGTKIKEVVLVDIKHQSL